MGNRRSRVELYVHLVWGTYRRQPSISAAMEADLFRVIAAKSVELGCAPCAIGGTDYHLHLFARLHPSTPVARLVAEVKCASSHFGDPSAGSRTLVPLAIWMRCLHRLH